MANEYRVTTYDFEVLIAGDPKPRVTAFGAEVLLAAIGNARVTAMAFEVLVDVKNSANRRRQLICAN
jgi:hypothetical protein